MEVLLEMVDELVGSGEGERPVAELRLASEKITARELIRRRVENEVREHNRRPRKFFRGLVQPADAERTLDGYRLEQPRPLDVDEQVRVALEAFESDRFFLLFDDRQVEDLDEELVLTESRVVSFVRLLPLVGG